MTWHPDLHPRGKGGRFTWAKRISTQIQQHMSAQQISTSETAHYRRTRSGVVQVPAREAQRLTFYHGTTAAGLRDVRPADQHRGHVTFPHDTSRGHAYATTSLRDAWHYAEMAWNASGTGIPRVYQVHPTGVVEVDPRFDAQGRSRSNNENDARSKHPFKVLREVPMPRRMGRPGEWR